MPYHLLRHCDRRGHHDRRVLHGHRVLHRHRGGRGHERLHLLAQLALYRLLESLSSSVGLAQIQ